ncbi:hypothetical protein COLO4_19862 [Corchorus olitorius]|uniref:Uncharacterized protein n=1 Tax=Corchorus olitorius TaxID=93759 RepID=A0A1R3J2Z4_9ROSI|nr:hypothetical protein COLO4_19862 [Corchorus olitorius]
MIKAAHEAVVRARICIPNEAKEDEGEEEKTCTKFPYAIYREKPTEG